MNNIKLKLKFSLSKLINYFIIISFLLPRGYAEFNVIYNQIFNYCIWISTIIIWIQFFLLHLKKMTIKRDSLLITNYFAITIVITCLIRGFLINGYQKLITYPSVCLFTICNLKKDPKSFLNAINNVFLVLFILNQFVLREFFLQQYHITFLGHVQMISQIGTLAIFCALIFWMMFYEKKTRTILIVLLSLFTMITTDASSAQIACVILCIFGVLYKLKNYKFLTYNSKIYIIAGMIFSIVIICISVINNVKYNNAITWLDFSGRSFIWLDALSKIENSVIFGHGVEGVLLNVFWNKWSNATGFNYAHNQILQNFLDGGVVVSIAFIYMIITFCKNTKNITNLKYKVLINSILITFLFVMVFESTTYYCYMFICFAIIYVLPDIINSKEKGEITNGSF